VRYEAYLHCHRQIVYPHHLRLISFHELEGLHPVVRFVFLAVVLVVVLAVVLLLAFAVVVDMLLHFYFDVLVAAAPSVPSTSNESTRVDLPVSLEGNRGMSVET